MASSAHGAKPLALWHHERVQPPARPPLVVLMITLLFLAYDVDDPVHRVAARHICALAAAEADESGDSLEPIYLRPPDAQRWRERDTSTRTD